MFWDNEYRITVRVTEQPIVTATASGMQMVTIHGVIPVNKNGTTEKEEVELVAWNERIRETLINNVRAGMTCRFRGRVKTNKRTAQNMNVYYTISLVIDRVEIEPTAQPPRQPQQKPAPQPQADPFAQFDTGSTLNVDPDDLPF